MKTAIIICILSLIIAGIIAMIDDDGGFPNDR